MRAFHTRGSEQKQRQESVICIPGILRQKFQFVTWENPAEFACVQSDYEYSSVELELCL